MERRPSVRRDLLARLSAVPGIDSVTEVAIGPVSGSGWNNNVRVDGEAQGYRESYFNRVGPEYFKTMGSTLLAGREIDGRDTASSPAVAIVNEAFAHRFFNGASPIGRRFRVEPQRGEKEEVYEIGTASTAPCAMGRPTAFLAAAQDSRRRTFLQYAIHARMPLPSAMNG